MGPSWHPKRIKIRPQLRKADFAKNIIKPTVFDDFLVFGGPTWEQKPTPKRSKNRSKKGGDLSIDFWSILEGFGGQVGRQNGAKIDQKRH